MEHVDVTGEVCPRPALIVRRRLSALDAGDTLVVRGDYPPAEQNLRRTCENHGFSVEGGDEEDGDSDQFELHITATDDAALAEE
jgi:tRNA 2-thiouridine synthesizing protein A